MAAATAAAAVPVAAAREEFVDVTANGKGDVTVRLWLRTWGNRASGIPVLFVHGGPGNCVADYKDINADFFDNDKFFVVEPDQRGTGRSTPSVRESAEHMQHYLDISLEQMSADFESVRKHLGLEQWLVFGGSWGSTLALDYAERHPQRCLALMVRGVFLNTQGEMDDVYNRRAFEPTNSSSSSSSAAAAAAAAVAPPPEVEKLKQRQLKEYDIFCDQVVDAKTPALMKETLAYDSEALLRAYEDRILRGDRMAIWSSPRHLVHGHVRHQ